MPSYSTVVPALEEEENIRRTVNKLFEIGASEVIVVDDGSADNTITEALEAGARVIHRHGISDLSRSVVAGLEQASHERVVVMDGDGQHPPEKAAELASKLDIADLAIGVRRSLSFNGKTREIVSRTAEMIAKTFHPELRGLQDPLSGFFAVNKSHVNVDDLDPIGFKILIELVVKHDFEHEEILYTFRERRNGNSSINTLEVVKFLIHMMALKISTGWESEKPVSYSR